jgi:L-2-hydroxyglutarate oxidase LhgO
VVIGAGAVGLAIARRLALLGRETLVLEAGPSIGGGISSRNSEVIHAGIYYPSGSLKARLCLTGRQQLYEYCRERGIGHARCGKLIVATSPDQCAALAALLRHGQANGVTDLTALEPAQVHALEPQLACERALLSPATGIIDSHALMLALQADLEQAHGTVVLASPVVSGRCADDGIYLTVGTDATPLRARMVINAAGLGAQSLAHSLARLPRRTIPPLYYAKGSYFLLNGRSPFAHLVYPLPEAGGLGVHLTLDLGGQARFGPDVEWIDSPDYAVDAQRAPRFYSAIRRYWPDLADGALRPGYAGVRPKLSRDGAPAADFDIQGPAVHGIPGLVNLYGIESPGLTASLAIAEYVAALL